MFTLWFTSPGYLSAGLMLNLDVIGLVPAQAVWDRLSSAGFEMQCPRPAAACVDSPAYAAAFAIASATA